MRLENRIFAPSSIVDLGQTSLQRRQSIYWADVAFGRMFAEAVVFQGTLIIPYRSDSLNLSSMLRSYDFQGTVCGQHIPRIQITIDKESCHITNVMVLHV